MADSTRLSSTFCSRFESVGYGTTVDGLSIAPALSLTPLLPRRAGNSPSRRSVTPQPQQRLQIIPRELAGKPAFITHHGGHQLSLLILQLRHALFDRVAR